MDNSQSNQNQNDDPMIGKLIFDRYKLKKRLGSGSFGSIYSAEYQNQEYAINLEEKLRGQNLLENEAYIMSYLNGPGLPFVKSYGYSSKHNILVMELMGKSLEDIFESFVVKKMTPRCVCNIGYQMIEILEFIHNKHVIHRDIKPDNFVIGLKEKRKYIYILDFGLSKKYRSSRTLQHYQIVKSKNLTGTARYASINALNGLTQSRRDDLEAVGYVLMYFLRGKLPWQGIPVKNKEDRYRKIMEKKIQTSPEELCQGFPNEFAEYINYTRNLEYEQDPDYDYLKNLFVKVLNRDGLGIDCFYDWDKETINYFRDFKNYEKNENNKNKADSSSISTNQRFNQRDNNSYFSNENKANNFVIQNNNYLNKNNSKTNTISMANYQRGLVNGVANSTSNYESSALYQKKNEQKKQNNNEIAKAYIQEQPNEINQNDINAHETNNILADEKNNGKNNINNSGKFVENPQLSNENNNVEKSNNDHQRKLRPEKDNKCCIIF